MRVEALGCVRLAHCVSIMGGLARLDQLLLVRVFCKPQHGDGSMRAYCVVVQPGTIYV